jgi:hypothetical protein
MEINLVTKEDLLRVKQEILEQIKHLLDGQSGHPEYLKSKDVKRILGCSDSKLESLRKSGRLKFTKLQGTLYYISEDVYELLEPEPARN